jgi:hypothetical protein
MLTAACPPGTWRRIVDRAVREAAAGDAKAREWLGRYLLGLPKDGALVKEAAVFQMEQTKTVDTSDETIARIVNLAIELRAPVPTIADPRLPGVGRNPLEGAYRETLDPL